MFSGYILLYIYIKLVYLYTYFKTFMYYWPIFFGLYIQEAAVQCKMISLFYIIDSNGYKYGVKLLFNIGER